MGQGAGRVAVAPRVLFLGLSYAGHETRFLNLQANTRNDPRIRPTYRWVTGWRENGAIERLPGLPNGIKGRMRAVLQAAPLATMPRPDVIWSAVSEVAAPYAWAQLGSLRRPHVQDLDCTFDQLEELAPVYFGRPPRRGLSLLLARLRERAVWRSVSLFTPWSRWAADALRRQGIESDRIRIIPPAPARRPAISRMWGAVMDNSPGSCWHTARPSSGRRSRR